MTDVRDRAGQQMVARWVLRTGARLARASARIDSLNVYPVPDGDTGTNLLRTFAGGLDAARGGVAGHDQRERFVRGIALGARGNSGVIASQLVRGAAEALRDAPRLDGPAVAAAFTRADSLAWAAVGSPVEGTILSVSSAAAAAARAAATQSLDPVVVVDAALVAAEDALAATPTQLPALAQAGVVDAGGTGYVLALQALADTLHGSPDNMDDLPPEGPVGTEGQPEVSGPAYEVMYQLAAAEEAADHLRESLAELGTSVVVAPGNAGMAVHVHTDDVAGATRAGLAAGPISALRVVDLRTGADAPEVAARGRRSRGRVGLVACADAPGIVELLREAGARVVLSGPGARASTGDLLEAVLAERAAAVLLLTNDRDVHLAADQAAREAAAAGVTVHVVPTTSQLQGIAGVSVFDPSAPAAESAAAVLAAARAVRSGRVVRAERAAVTPAGPVAAGQAMGVVGGEAVVLGSEVEEAAAGLLDHLMADGGELVTLVTGQGAEPSLAERLGARARERGADVEVLDGRQPLAPLLIGVE